MGMQSTLIRGFVLSASVPWVLSAGFVLLRLLAVLLSGTYIIGAFITCLTCPMCLLLLGWVLGKSRSAESEARPVGTAFAASVALGLTAGFLSVETIVWSRFDLLQVARGPSISEMALKYRNFKGLPLSSEHFKNANLAGADLTGTNLYGTRFTRVDLRGAALASADMRKAKLLDVDLRGADLTGADLRGAAFCNTTMPDGTVRNSDCWLGFGWP